MSGNSNLFPVRASEIAPRTKPSNYPPLFAARMAGRIKRSLGNYFALTNFGVNLTTLAPGAISALRHAHSRQDEFIYVLTGRIRLHYDTGIWDLEPGMCAGFAAGTGNAHHLINLSDEDASYLEIGDRTPGDEGSYPDDDLMARQENGVWAFFHKNGTPY